MILPKGRASPSLPLSMAPEGMSGFAFGLPSILYVSIWEKDRNNGR